MVVKQQKRHFFVNVDLKATCISLPREYRLVTTRLLWLRWFGIRLIASPKGVLPLYVSMTSCYYQTSRKGKVPNLMWPGKSSHQNSDEIFLSAKICSQIHLINKMKTISESTTSHHRISVWLKKEWLKKVAITCKILNFSRS